MNFLHHIRNFLLKLLVKTTVGVKVIVVKDNKILLLKHTYGQGWHLPGGGVDVGESPAMAASRELIEETGIVAKSPLTLFGFYYHFISGRHDYVGLYVLENFETQGFLSAEVQSIEWFSFDELPHDLSPGTHNRIQEYLGKTAVSDKW